MHFLTAGDRKGVKNRLKLHSTITSGRFQVLIVLEMESA